jgi:hypothetical protein
MSEILLNVYLYAILVSAIIFFIGIVYIFSNKKSVKYLTFTFCVVGILTIYYFDNMFKGYPIDAVEGQYRIQGWEISETDRQIYVMALDENKIPKNFFIPFTLEDALALQEASGNIGIYKEISLLVERDEETGNKSYKWTLERRFKEVETQNERNIVDDSLNEDSFERDFDPIEDADTIERINRDYPRPNSNNRQQNLDQ